MHLDKERLYKEFLIKSSRSGGSGGQNVNKVSTKIEIVFNIPQSEVFDEQQKLVLLEKLISKVDKEGCLHVVAQETRSQLLNKQLAVEKLFQLLTNAFKVEKARLATKVPRSVKEKRKSDKKSTSLRKEGRKKPRLD